MWYTNTVYVVFLLAFSMVTYGSECQPTDVPVVAIEPPSIKLVPKAKVIPTIPKQSKAPYTGYYSGKRYGKYDKYFKRHMRTYLPFKDWHILKAQGIAESNLIADATSPANAYGVMQFLIPTFKDVETRLFKEQRDIFNPADNIEAGAYYMSVLRRGWGKSGRSEYDRYALAQSAYNAGMGNILKSQKRCNNVRDYPGIIKCLPLVTGRHADETINYVKRIDRIYKRLVTFR